MKFIHGHKLEFHATMNMKFFKTELEHPCDKVGLQTKFFMAERTPCFNEELPCFKKLSPWNELEIPGILL